MFQIITAIAGILFLSAGTAFCESFTLETYYPSPAGIYTNIIVTSSTVLARDGGAVNVGTPAKPAKLDVNGNAKVTGVVVPGNLPSDPTDPAQKVEGAIYFNTTTHLHRVFRSGTWQDIGGGMTGPAVYQCPPNPGNIGGGAWGFYGCQGQITTLSYCYTIEYPNIVSYDCTYIGEMVIR